jgi:hypothetical protein
MQFKTLVASHMSVLAEIGAIIAPGLTTTNQLKDALALSTAITNMKLKPEHVTEVTNDISKQVQLLQNSKTHNTALASQLVDQFVAVNNQLIANNHQKQNGAGTQTQADQQTVHNLPKTAGQGASAV